MSVFDKNYRVCFPEKQIFISADHNWAFAAWELSKMYNPDKSNATLFHVDAHLDDIWDGILVDGLHKMKTLADVYDVTRELRIENFIWAGFATDSIENVIYVSRQKLDNHDPFDLSDWDFSQSELEPVQKLIQRKPYKGIRVDYIEELKELCLSGELSDYIESRSLILDLDLDYFNKSTDTLIPDLMSDERIRENLIFLRDLYDWDLITVALSPVYCSGDDSCWHIYQIFLDVFQLELSEAKVW